MLSADYKLTPVPSANYIEKNEPERYVKDIPVYAVNTYNSGGREGKNNYSRVYDKIRYLYNTIVDQRAQNNKRSRQKRDRKNMTIRGK